ncbi:uncharacterized protein THITE_2116977 [Thermothielavioides terrestris NRRL 8126]|uniref:AB hydrolase-1 domain-containing protein n=1 Tax=Thermothielavioides terrestris (strain ATCC 38088 / NRRL 8126) TaxID=578455 RepID=G2R7D9_THETT|nr:uncharacterized protein THITE_2116977 [Thermothielavioides terrestris NRRL 8126]AEO67848.1 hypothetical protein THITE_2116977 [Thermothielavioides terrestris NRRL 8126]
MSLAMLPRPSLTLTVPSLHDGLPIDCRVYHPPALAASPDAPPNAPPNAPSWQKHAAIIAHPYAPLGGCYDDPIVDIVAGTLLRLGFLVGTFNFRGAQGSAGRTSWTAKAERGDYMAVVGFVSHYVHFLDPFSPAGAGADHALEGGDAAGDAAGDVPSAIRIRPPTPDYVPATTPILLLGGYSYGAMITSQLPSFEAIVALFISPECGSPAAEVRLRAQHLAEMQNTVLASARNAAIDRPTPTTPRRHVGLRVGGDEENRTSHDTRRSLSAESENKMRHGVAEYLSRTKKRHSRSCSGQSLTSQNAGGKHDEPEGAPSTHLLSIPGWTAFRPAYLLVSPLQGIVTNLVTLSVSPTLSSLPGKVWARLSTKGSREAAGLETPEPPGPAHAAAADAEAKLTQNTTLAIYGDRDGFVPVRKLRAWASRLQAVPDSRFRAHEVSGADHFWASGNVAFTLREAVRAFGASLLDHNDIDDTLK